MDPERTTGQSGSPTQYPSIETLSGSNYASWSFQMKLVLMECDLWTTVQPGEELKDTDDHRKLRLHERRQEKAFAKICLALGNEQQQHVQHLNSPKDIWEELQRLYAPKDSGLRVLQLRRQLYSEKLETHESMDSYLGKMNRLVSELTNVGDCIDDGDLAMTILCGLPEDWDIVASSICNLPESEFCCATVKRRLIAEWARRIENSGGRAEAMTATTIEKKLTARVQLSKGKLVCFKCGKMGHFARDYSLRAKNPGGHIRSVERKQRSVRPCNMFASYDTPVGHRLSGWIIDSGATHHMCPDERYFTTLNKTDTANMQVCTADGSTTLAAGRGTVAVKLLHSKGMLNEFVAHNSMLVPGIRQGVLSVRQMVDNNRRIIFDRRGCHIYDEHGNLLIEAQRQGRLYVARTVQKYSTKGREPNETSSCMKLSVDQWHQRRMHVSKKRILQMVRRQAARGLDCSVTALTSCEDCQRGKSTRQPFRRHLADEEASVASRPLDLVHCDLMGPMDTPQSGKSEICPYNH
ncbi:hypothetical protein M513_12801 [Trichuris suis]|uniref:CCHC-type domain-containing protein n=1 Tax=Trichuris suis TaxID=68888 RepID=A0A085LMX7_9BILA|nr:hypothetical protein M513_12801 [Trichuris suis]